MEHLPRDRRTAIPEVTFLSWLASLGLAIDMANGAPETTVLRGTWVAVVAARELGLDVAETAAATFGALFRYLGCTSYALEESRLLGDEHEAARVLAPHDKKDQGPLLRAIATELGPDQSAFERALRTARILAAGSAFSDGYEASHCEGAVLLASRLAVRETVTDVLSALHERWDGEGGPSKLARTAIPVAARVVHVAREATVHFVLRGGEPGVVRCLERRAKGQLDPDMCKTLAQSAAFLAAFREEPLWDNVLSALEASFEHAFRARPTLEDVACVFGDFADQKCPIFLGHARRVASLVTGAAGVLGLDPVRTTCLVRAAWLHDIGRVSVPNRVWQIKGSLGPIEWEKVRLHPYVGERICQHLDAGLGRLVGAHHERSDGSGYANGSRADLLVGVLAAADVYAALGEDRPHRERLDQEARRRTLEREASEGRLPHEAVRAVLIAEGHVVDGRSRPPSEALSAREREVLSLVARGLSNKEIASSLRISSRTVQTHTIHAYDKLGVRTRAGAALRASELGLLG